MRKGERVVVAGSIGQRPQWGGHAWVFLQYLLGLRRLGHEVLFVDRMTSASEEAGVRYVASVMAEFGFADAYCVLGVDGRAVAGLDRPHALRRASDAILLLNINGYLSDPDFLTAVGRRVYLDIDPGFSQMWRELGLHDLYKNHDVLVTIAENIGQPDCRIPTGGLEWRTTRPPIVLDMWPSQKPNGGSFTSIGSWRGPFAPVEFEGTSFGLRVHEFRNYASLPRLTGQLFDLALDIDERESNDLELLRGGGWHLVDPLVVAGSPMAYQRFIAGSKAEFMVAKGMYVKTRGGWFSDRSAGYLASARPVIAQDTGLASLYPVGEGLLLFTTLDEAAVAVESVVTNYARHSAAAREIAISEFDSDRVLARLIENAAV
jgi:hypothetical protein